MNARYLFTLQSDTLDNIFNLNASDVLIGYRLGNNGQPFESVMYNVSGYIDISTAFKVIFPKGVHEFCIYEKDKIFSKYVFVNTEESYEYILPINATYIRVVVNTSLWNEFSVNKDYKTNALWDDNLALRWALQSNERFYRQELSGNIRFIRNDYNYIYSQDFESEFILRLYISRDMGKSFAEIFCGTFAKTDCVFNESNRTIEVKPEVMDRYTDILNNIENEYNLIELMPETVKMKYTKRPMIQVYSPGETVVSNFVGSNYWESDVNSTDDGNFLTETCHFGVAMADISINITTDTATKPEDIGGVYYGNAVINSTIFPFLLTITLTGGNGNYFIKLTANYLPISGSLTYELIRYSDYKTLFTYTNSNWNYNYNTYDFTMSAVESANPPATGEEEGEGEEEKPEISGMCHCSQSSSNVYTRILLDTDTYNGNNTYPLMSDDIINENLNYHYVYPVTFEVIETTSNTSKEPTKYGKAPNGEYYMPPSDGEYYPVAQSTWSYTSKWLNRNSIPSNLEANATTECVLKDGYLLSSVLQKLLAQINPNITHKPEKEYSEFFYGDINPIILSKYTLIVTPKSNIVRGEYKEPAKTAITTLKQFTDMLKNMLQCYWFIDEENRFRIEHISWFMNGGTYNGNSSIIGYDLTLSKNIRNSKSWDFAKYEYEFDKDTMPERYTFGWMDEVSMPFMGQPLIVKSKFVQKDRKEEINIANFTSDIDYMLLQPNAISNDGFAIFAVSKSIVDGTYKTILLKKTINGITYDLQNGMLSAAEIQDSWWLYNLPAKTVNVNGKDTTVKSIQRKKKQKIVFPIVIENVNPYNLIKTNIGNGEIENLEINLSNENAEAQLQYDTYNISQ